jgi:hypothetical protein
MSAIKLSTPSSGSISLTPADTASNFTITVPAVTATMAIDGPAFSAYASSPQTITSGTWTKVQINTEEFDTNACFDNTTNYRFTPNVAGYYQISGQASVANANTNAIVAIYKNGALFKRGSMNPTNAFSYGNSLSTLVYLNGTTDYIELYTIHNLGANGSLATGLDVCYFQAAMVRGA